MNRSQYSYNFLWLSIALMPLIIIAFLLPVHPHDYWWYLRLGKDILENGAVPIVDTYSSLQFGQPIVYQSWLSALLFWLIFKKGGISLTIFFVALLIGITYALLWILVKQEGVDPRLSTVLILIAGLSGSNNWGVRPQLFTYVLFLTGLWILLKWHRQETKVIWGLIPLSILWTNLHGSFILLFILIGLAFVFGNGNKTKLFWIALITVLVTLINPRGIVLWQSVLETFISPGIRNLSPEWLPPINEGWQMNLFFVWLLLLIPIATFSRNRMSLFQWMLLLSFSWLALSGLRYVIWSLFIFPIITAFLLDDFILRIFDKPQEIKFPAFNFGLGIVFLITTLVFIPTSREQWWKNAPPSIAPETPIGASNWLKQHPEISGLMWNEVIFGSYLIYDLPSRPVWFDPRIQVIFTAEQAEQYFLVDSVQPGWDDFLSTHDVNILMLSSSQTRLVYTVENSSEWCKQYEDDVSMILVRCSQMP